jgi:WD40 repeat protein
MGYPAAPSDRTPLLIYAGERPRGRDWKMHRTGDRAVRIWDPTTGKAVAMMRTDSSVSSCVYSPDGRLVVAGTTAGLCAYVLHPQSP